MKAPRRKLIRVSVLESDPMRVVGLQDVFRSEPDIDVRAGSVESVLQSHDDKLVLMTTDRGPSFSAAMSALKAVRPKIRIIVTGPGKKDEDILRAVTAGAKGYVAEEAPSEVLKKAIREVHNGSVWLPRRVLAVFIEASTPVHHRVPTRRAPTVSDRESEVLRLLVGGCSNGEIAHELGIRQATVKTHVAQLLRKFGVPNRTALTVAAVTNPDGAKRG
jgi:DNA-binding NarL/FixJ family response regulator